MASDGDDPSAIARRTRSNAAGNNPPRNEVKQFQPLQHEDKRSEHNEEEFDPVSTTPSDTTIHLYKEQDEHSPFDSDFTPILHNIFNIDFVKKKQIIY